MNNTLNTKMFSNGAHYFTFSGLLISFLLVGCSTPQQKSASNLAADGTSAENNRYDQRAQQIKARQERDQDQKDRQMVLQSHIQNAQNAQNANSPTQRPAQTMDMRSLAASTRVLPQKAGKIETTPGKVLDLANKMPEGQLYAEILDRYEAHDLIGLESRSKVFLGKFTNSERRDDVMYMQGLMELGERNYGVALTQFNKILRDHPEGRKAPSALFAKGITFERMNLKREAKQALAKVIDLFPGSPEALRASTEVKMIKK
jgi:TolA-binding protein